MQRQRLNSEKDWEEWKTAIKAEYSNHVHEMNFDYGPVEFPVIVVWLVNYPNDYFELAWDTVAPFH